MKKALAQIGATLAGGAVAVLALCMLGGAYYPHSIAGAVWRVIFIGA